jgi:GT2 family glycosyltransferase
MRLSVVIPTRNRLEKLERTLDALAGQELGGHSAEVIVVDNGCDDGTPEAVRRRVPSFPLPLRLVGQPAPGASAARNAGIREARFEVVLFLGDDTRPRSEDVVRSHADLHERRPEPTYGVLGRVAWAPELHVTPFMEWLEGGAQFGYRDLTPGPVGRDYFYSAHLSLKRDALQGVGGFDERLPFLYEDVEIGARLLERGLDLEYRPELVVLHDHEFTLEQWMRRQRIAGRSARILNSIRPEDPPIAPRPVGPRWAGFRLAGAALRLPSTDWNGLPRRLRTTVYRVLHKAAYAEGYRGASAGVAGRPGAE